MIEYILFHWFASWLLFSSVVLLIYCVAAMVKAGHSPMPAPLGRCGYDELWGCFALSRASWLTLPRVCLHEMPDEWQGKMAALLNEFVEYWDGSKFDFTYYVQLRQKGKIIKAPYWIANYRHPDRAMLEYFKAKKEV